MPFYYGISGDIRDDVKRGSTESEVPGADITRSQKWATAFLDGFLERVYPDDVPFASGSVPAMVDWMASQLCVYFVYRSLYKMKPPNYTEMRRDYYEEVLNMLQKISDGAIDIPELVTKRAAEVEANITDYTPIFGLDEPTDWKVDTDRMDEQEDARD